MQLLLFVSLLLGFSTAKPTIHRSVQAELEKGSDGVIVASFAAAMVKDAYSPAAVLNSLQKCRVVGENVTLDEFVSSGEYAEKRGDFVLRLVQRQHAQTRRLLDQLQIPREAILTSVPISNLFVIRNLPGVYDRLKDSEGLLEISTNLQFKVPQEKKTHVPTKSAQPVQWNIDRIGAPVVWKKGRSRGEGIVIGVADTGVLYTHPNLLANYRGLRGNSSHGNPDKFEFNHNYNWWDGVREAVIGATNSTCPVAGNVPCDDEGHGTHCTSTAGGLDGYGVAPGAKWIGCRNMQSGVGSTITYLNCLNFFLAPHDLQGKNPRPDLRPHVVGNSYGCPDAEGCSLYAMTAAVNILRAAGIFMSVSAGNEGPGCSTHSAPPSYEPQVISVGAVNHLDYLATFSSRGPGIMGMKRIRKPDLVAPGVEVRAAVLDDGFATYSGTSMASPHVTGAAALIMANCPCVARNVAKVQAFLQKTAIKLYPGPSLLLGNTSYCGGDTVTSYPNNYFGYGRIDVAAAVRSCIKYCSQK